MLGPINDAVGDRQIAEIKVGVGATKLLMSDRYPATVIHVHDENTLVVQMDRYVRSDKNGLSESQDYDYGRNSDGAVYIVTRRKNGRWVTLGESMKHGQRWAIGERSAYQDPSF